MFKNLTATNFFNNRKSYALELTPDVQMQQNQVSLCYSISLNTEQISVNVLMNSFKIIVGTVKKENTR
jgi:hypothetical protein